jgi:hypothetical protein
MEIKPFFSVLIILAVLAVVGVVFYRTTEQAPPEQALPEQTLPEQALGTGILKLYLSDAPMDAENVRGVYITINEIQYHIDGQWITCEEFEGPKTYNLLELTGGNITLLGEFTLPAGHYTQIRFMLDIAEKASSRPNQGCYIEFADNSTQPLLAPSGGTTGYKAIGHFEVPVNGTVEVTADFDVRNAVVVAGFSYILKPTIKLIVNY